MAKEGVGKIAIFVIAIFLVFLGPFAKYQELRSKNSRLEADIISLKKDITQLTKDKKRLETDITYIEQKARDNLGMVRKGEIVLRAESKK